MSTQIGLAKSVSIQLLLLLRLRRAATPTATISAAGEMIYEIFVDLTKGEEYARG